MKKNKLKQIVMLAGAFGVCGVEILGCYPLVPAYFTAAVLEDANAVWMTAVMYIGMLCFMPLTAMVKYAVALIVMAGAVKLVQWANEGCPSFLAGILAAASTMILSFCGGLLEWRDQLDFCAMFLEGTFAFGAVILLNRILHIFLEWKIEPAEKQERVSEHGKEERLSNYAESFEGLSRVFLAMSRKKEYYSTGEALRGL